MFRDMIANKRFWLVAFSLFFTIFNFNLYPLLHTNLYLWQFSFLVFIGWGLMRMENFSHQSLAAFMVFLLMIGIGTYLGRDNPWLLSDLAKLFQLGASIFIFANLFAKRADLEFFIKTLSVLFIASILINIPANLEFIATVNRLVIASVGKGGEDLGWAAAALYILRLLVSAESKIYKPVNIINILLLSIVILSLSRAAMLTVFVYALISQKKQAVLDSMVSIVLSGGIIYLALKYNYLNSKAFWLLNGYRFDLSILWTKLVGFLSHKISSLSVAPTVHHSASILVTGIGGNSQNMASTVNDSHNWLLTGRSLIWSSFLQHFLQAGWLHQLFGFGVGSVTLKVQSADFYSRDVHNLYLDTLLNFGVVGLLVFLIALKKSFKVFIKTHSWESTSILITILVAGMFNGLWRFTGVIWITALFAAMPFIYNKFKNATVSDQDAVGNQ